MTYTKQSAVRKVLLAFRQQLALAKTQNHLPFHSRVSSFFFKTYLHRACLPPIIKTSNSALKVSEEKFLLKGSWTSIIYRALPSSSSNAKDAAPTRCSATLSKTKHAIANGSCH